MTVAMLGLPLVSVLLAALLFPSDATHMTPLIIVGVVVAYVASARLAPRPAPAAPATPPPSPASTTAPSPS